MTTLIAENWPLFLIAFLIGIATAWWVWAKLLSPADEPRRPAPIEPMENIDEINDGSVLAKATGGAAALAGAATATAAATASKTKTTAKKAASSTAKKATSTAKKTTTTAKKATSKAASTAKKTGAAAKKTTKTAAKKTTTTAKKAAGKTTAKAKSTAAKTTKAATKTAVAAKKKATTTAKKAASTAKTAAKKAAPKKAAPKKAPAKKAAAKPSIPDNLELLKGVGPKLNNILRDLGVTSFEQVKAWTASDIREIDSKLGAFAGRINRDNWVDQAKLLSKGDVANFEKKYGSLGSEIRGK